MGPNLIASVEGASVARAGKVVLTDLNLKIHSGDRIYVSGENGAGKSSLLSLFAGRLHPWQNQGERKFPWHAPHESLFHLRRYVALVGREEQLRLQKIYAQQTVRDLLLGHSDGDDFLYRDPAPQDIHRVDAVIGRWHLQALASRKLKTMSLGEMRLAAIARADMFERRLYLLDEVFNSLSDRIAGEVISWISGLSPSAAVLFTGHGAPARQLQLATRTWQVRSGVVTEFEIVPRAQATGADIRVAAPGVPDPVDLVKCDNADFYHDFQPIFKGVSFTLRSGDRILLTGPNGSGKTTLLRILHGDFRPAWQSGTLGFLHALEHETRPQLWRRVQLVAAAHFDYFLPEMTVANVLASRLSGSLYSFPETLPEACDAVVAAFHLKEFLPRHFQTLSEGEKTRVLLARAFLEAAPVYLIDEGFMALSDRFFSQALDYLNALPAEAAVVIAANERILDIRNGLKFRLSDWQLAHGRLSILL